MRSSKFNLCLPLYLSPAAALISSLNAQDVNFDVVDGDIATAGNWTGGALPGDGETGTINVNGFLDIGDNLNAWLSGAANLVIDNGAVITTSGDWGHFNAASSTFNNSVLTVGDDIFSNNSIITFNEGSSASTADDFEANGLSIININGGMHTAGDIFGAQSNNEVTFGTLNLMGGTVSAGQFRVADFAVINLGGSIVLSGSGDTSLLTGTINVASDWSGSWVIDSLTGTDWETEVTGGGWTLDGVVVDAAIFESEFQVTDSGTALSLFAPPTPPLLVSTVPVDGETDVLGSANLVATFDEEILLSGAGSVTIRNLTNPEDIVISLSEIDPDGSVSVSGREFTIDPAVGLTAGDEYVIEISNTALEDIDGNPYAGLLESDDPNWSFTVDGSAPVLTGTIPSDDATNIALNPTLTAIFNENIALGDSGTITIRNLTTPSDLIITIPSPEADEAFSIAGSQLTINLAESLVSGDEYVIEISTGAIENLSGLSYAGLLSTDDPNWSFTTDGIAPTSSGMGPFPGSGEVLVGSNLSLTFSEDVQIGEGTITIHLASDDSVVEVIDVTSGNVILNGGEVSIDPSLDLATDTAYYVIVTSGAFTDLAGNPYTGVSDPSAWTFTTESEALIIFADNFNREDGSDLNASTVGQSGALTPLNWVEVVSQGDSFIEGEELNIGESGAGGGWAVLYPDYNFIDPSILVGNGFDVSIDLVNGTSLGNTRFTGIAVGHSRDELDAWSSNNPSSEPFDSDFFIGFDPTGTNELKVFTNGTEDSQTEFTLTGTQVLNVEFSGFSDFAAGTLVSYEAFIDGESIVTGTFTWSGTDENYLALYSNFTNNQAVIDNFVVRGNVALDNSFVLDITTNGSTLDFSWNALAGREYDLVSTDDLEAEQNPSLWAPYNDGVTTHEAIPSTGTGMQTLTGVRIVGPKRFFALIERPATVE